MSRLTTLLSISLLVLAACGPSAVATPGSPTPPPEPMPASPAVVAAGPPVARLAAEGGDPVVGQLGTYAWRETGSDSPWLPGAPIAVGAGEPLLIEFDPPIPIESWRARHVPADADGPDGAILIGKGAGVPAFKAPAAGAWTIEVHAVFAGGLGDASYFWRLDVR